MMHEGMNISFGLQATVTRCSCGSVPDACRNHTRFVVGTGTTMSCTEALDSCLPGGGSFDNTVTFDCGGVATVTVTSAKVVNTATAIDGRLRRPRARISHLRAGSNEN